MDEFYKPYSIIDLFGDNTLKISWYKVWEDFYEIDNSTLIFGYDKSKAQENQSTIVRIDEYFDWYDFSFLKGFVDYDHHYKLLFDKVSIPIEPKESSSLISKLKCNSQNKNIVCLFIDETFESPFEIHGYCDVTEDR